MPSRILKETRPKLYVAALYKNAKILKICKKCMGAYSVCKHPGFGPGFMKTRVRFRDLRCTIDITLFVFSHVILFVFSHVITYSC